MTPNVHYQPGHLLWSLLDSFDPPYRFRATERTEAAKWQESTRAAFAAALGADALAPLAVAPNPRSIESVDKGEYLREKVVISSSRASDMPCYLLLPKDRPRPLPLILALHGHGYGVKDIVGLWEDGSERDTPDGYHRDFAVALCRAGFAVAAPEISCFGERQSDFSYLDRGQGVPTTCTHSAMLAFHLGISIAGIRVHDAIKLLDYLQTRPEIDAKRIGAMGISGGGMHTLFSACVDPRIRACVISGYFSEFRSSVLAMSHCACNFVPGMWRFGEMSDLIGLVAPRPVLFEAGTHDPIFPIEAVRRGVARAKEVYALFGAEGEIATDLFEGRHRISGELAYGFLSDALSLDRGGTNDLG